MALVRPTTICLAFASCKCASAIAGSHGLDVRLTVILTRLDIPDTILLGVVDMDYTRSKQEALQEKEDLLKQREQIAQEKERLDRANGEIERRLIGLEHILEGFEFLSNDIPPELEKPGFTEQIRRILQQASFPLTAIEIRNTLVAEGVEHSSKKNLLISIHTVLGRLESDLKKSEKDGKSAYVWKHTARRRHIFPSGQHGAMTTLRSLAVTPLEPPPQSSEPVPGALAPAVPENLLDAWKLGGKERPKK